MITCKFCKQEKNENRFMKNKRGKYLSKCKDCINSAHRDLYGKTKPNEMYEQGIKDCVKIVRNLLDNQIKARVKMGDETGEEYYTNVLGWISYIDISNELSLENGQREYIGKKQEKKS
jgi:transcription elongation factor Elf1